MTFSLQNNTLCVESVPLSVIAEKFGTPCYVYSRAALTEAYQEFSDALKGVDAQVCFAVKANSNLAVLNVFARLGAGFDLVSGGEFERAKASGGDPRKMVFSGIGKSHAEIVLALNENIGCFNVESAPELFRINEIAGKMNKIAPVSLRVNPNVDAKTHPYISTGLKENKFGIAHEEAIALFEEAAKLPNIKVLGIDCHIGSQLLEITPFSEALDKLLLLVDQLAAKNIHLEHLDLGGGLGISYREGEIAPSVKDYLAPVLARLKGRNLKLVLEPGRRLVGNAAVLLTSVEYLKPTELKNFAIVDAAMNDLARPALYDAWHDITPVNPHHENEQTWDIVGPICESTDFLGRERKLCLKEGDLLAIKSAGAYGTTMSSTFNSRPRVPEIMVDGDKIHEIRRRETVAELYAHESVLP